jgi:hypothetical protein
MEQCCLCQADIQEGVATSEFPCHHKCHTECFFRRAVEDGFAVTCDICDTLIVSQEVFDEIIGDRRGRDDEEDKKEIETLKGELTKNKDFKKDAKVFKSSIREYRSAKCAFKRKMADSKARFKQDIDGFINAITQIRTKYMADTKECEEYKRIALAQRRGSYYLTRLSRKWNVYPRNFYKTLIKQNDYWYFGRWSNRAAYIMKKAMRVGEFY